ncbi:conserved protein of unknown function [Oenococcus oeni]|nr:hypothetical protein [Oenococcus oeni]KTF01529.1 hypothetical protein SF2A35B_1809 [Lactiplantibacillus plantarum]KZT83146.1 hypothetical protein Nizo1839_0328 [Lactiplantibacillus plantarum]VDC14740.1 conserved protein of unknown function [Oenococcus oeni]
MIIKLWYQNWYRKKAAGTYGLPFMDLNKLFSKRNIDPSLKLVNLSA